MLVLQFLHLNANLLFTEGASPEQSGHTGEEFRFHNTGGSQETAARTHDHARADVAELGLLAVVVLELVRPVVERLDRLYGRSLVLLLLLHLFLINEVHLQK